eukprot:4494407-Amphidinium_carterae.4
MTVDRNKKVSPLSDRLTEQSWCEVGLTVQGNTQALLLHVVRYAYGPCGGRTAIDVKRARDAVVGKVNNTSQNWFSSWVQWWDKRLVKAGVEPFFHIRFGSAKHGYKQREPRVWSGIDMALLECPVLTSHALHVLLPGWCHNSSNRSNNDEVAAWRSFRDALYHRF